MERIFYVVASITLVGLWLRTAVIGVRCWRRWRKVRQYDRYCARLDAEIAAERK